MPDEPLLKDSLPSSAADIAKALRTTHPDVSGDFGASWWCLVRDAYEHGGGFRGAIRNQVSAYGEGSYEATSRASLRVRTTYLRQFSREDEETFERRTDASTYENHVAPIVDTYHGHLTRRAPKRSGPPVVEAWWSAADMQGVHVDTFVPMGLKRAQLYGWAACVFDRPSGEFAVGEVRTSARWCEPREVRDWQIAPDGSLDWIRLGCEREERDPVTGEESCVEEYTVWTRTQWVRVVLREVEEEKLTIDTIDGGFHHLGRVPVAVLRWQRPLTSRLYGVSQVNDVVPLAVNLFNVQSELTHHLRSAVFALLCIQSDDPDVLASLKLGTNNGMRYEMNAAAPSFVSPPPDVAATLATRSDELRASIYTAAKLERPHATAQGGDMASGIARGYEFAQTEAALAGAVGNLADFEREAAAIVALWDAAPGSSPAELAAIVRETLAATSVQYPQRFDVAGLQQELAAQLDALSDGVREQLPPTARKHARITVSKALAPEADAATEAAIELEAEQMYEADVAAMNAPPPPPPVP